MNWDEALEVWTILTSARIKDGNIGELIQLIELDVPLTLFTIMIYLSWNKMQFQI